MLAYPKKGQPAKHHLEAPIPTSRIPWTEEGTESVNENKLNSLGNSNAEETVISIFRSQLPGCCKAVHI